VKVLILSVGGSDAPIVKSIEHYKPDFVVFMCTVTEGQIKGSRGKIDGDGLIFKERVCSKCGYKEKEDRPSIVKQTGLKGSAYEIITVQADDLFECNEKADELIAKYMTGGHEVIVDYTGGTKSMAAGLVAAGMEHLDCKFSVVKGPRLDLVRVRDGMERVAKQPVNLAYVRRQKALCQNLLREWNFSNAAKVLENVSEYAHFGDEAGFDRMLYMCRAFAAWDKFDYRKALQLVEHYKKDELIAPYNKTLKKIIATLNWYEKWEPDGRTKPPGFMLVYDVLLNAERRAVQGNYDDAITRIYRAVEMYAQFCLRTGKPRLTSDDLDVSLLPGSCRGYYEAKRSPKNKVQIALADDYNLLVDLRNPVGKVWCQWKEKIIKVLEKRNFSFLAHGMIPLTENDYQDVKPVVWDFISECDESLGIKEGLKQARQLPQGI